MNLDFKKFKKISSDKNSTTLKHEDGHQLTIAHSALKPKHREQLALLPTHTEPKLDDGGSIQATGASGSSADNVPEPDPQKAKEMQKGAMAPGTSISEGFNNIKKGLGFTEGGQVNPKLEESKKQPAKPKKLADGGSPEEDIQVDENPAAPGVDSGIPQNMGELAQQQAAQQFLANQAPGSSTNWTGLMSTPESQRPQIPVPASMQDQSADSDRQPAADDQSTMAQPVSDTSDSDKAPSDAAMGSVMQGVAEQRQGIWQQAAAEQALAHKQSADLDRGIQQQQDLMAYHQQAMNDLNAERQNFISDIQKNYIKPEQYWDNHSKLVSGIGIILAGMDPKGRPNSALQFLNENMNRSIQAQAQNLNSRNNLLAANLHQFGNMNAAINMTRVMYNDMLSAYLKKSAAESMDPMAKARALQLDGQLQIQTAPLTRQQAMLMALQKAGAQGNQQNPDELINYLRMFAPEKAKEMESRYIPGVGIGSVPVPEKVRSEITERQNLQNQVSGLRQWASQHSGSMNPKDIAYGKALANTVQDAYRRANGQGVFREAEANFVKGVVADDPTAFLNKFRVDPKYQALENSNLAQLNGLKAAHGLPVQQQQAQPQYKTVNGVRYMRGPNGEAIPVK